MNNILALHFDHRTSNFDHGHVKSPVYGFTRFFQNHFEHAPFSLQFLSSQGRTLAVNRDWKNLWKISQEIIQMYILNEYIEIKQSKQKGLACLEVSDHDNGIAQHDLERIFNRFERVSSDHNIGGLGLGPYISKQIVLAHQGSIWAVSRLNKGTNFIVEMPLTDY